MHLCVKSGLSLITLIKGVIPHNGVINTGVKVKLQTHNTNSAGVKIHQKPPPQSPVPSTTDGGSDSGSPDTDHGFATCAAESKKEAVSFLF